jgi:DNA-binding response OmpR family regulator
MSRPSAERDALAARAPASVTIARAARDNGAARDALGGVVTRLTVVTEHERLAARLRGAFDAVRASAEPWQSLAQGELPEAFLIDADGVECLPLVEFLVRATTRPIVVLARETPAELISAYLESGADAVVGASSSLDECIARLRALTRRSPGESTLETCYRFGRVVLYPERRSVVLDGKALHFTRTEFNLLLTLAQRLDQVTSHRQLMLEVWGQEYLSARHYLRVYVRRVREKIEVDANRPELLIAYRAKGYLLRSAPQPAPPQLHFDVPTRHHGSADVAAGAGGTPYAPSPAG